MFIRLPETKEKLATIIDSNEILCFNINSIAFKNGSKIDSCDEWNKVLEKATKHLNNIFENTLRSGYIPIDYRR